MKKNLFYNLSLSMISITLVLMTGEIVMRYAWRMSGWVERPIYRRSPNPYLRYELIPGSKIEGMISINPDGFRGPQYPISKPEGVFRIIMLGDSETFSYMLKREDTLPVQLENLLNKNSGGLKYEVLNFGVEGYNTFQELEQLKVKGLKYAPDLIILNYVFNDPEPGEYYFDKSFLMRHSATVRYFTYRIKKALIKKERKKLNLKTEIDHFYYLHQPKYFDRVRSAVLEIADVANELGGKLILVIFPTSSIEVKDFKENYPYWKLHSLVKSIRSDNIVFIDIIEEFNRLNMSPQEVSINYKYNESHKNPAAIRVIAEYILSGLRNEKLIPGQL
ncbi:MAG: hypothetical protein JW788_03695 [Candidatus Omnitrophica bacterium]|nr:hypothetical protein [Candidatus Omnitrophota bacterium]